MARIQYRWPENLMRRLEPQPNGCIYYTGYIMPNGYGLTCVDGVKEYAHRAMYRLMVGPVPAGSEIDHTCHDSSCPANPPSTCLHRRCVNPGHLVALSHQENVVRGNTPAGRNARKTHCKWGHEFTPENTYRSPSSPNKRACLKCRTRHNQNRRR